MMLLLSYLVASIGIWPKLGDLVNNPEFWGSLPQWLTFGGVVTFVGLLMRWQILNRKLSLDAKQVEDHTEAEALKGYRAEATLLRKEVAGVRRDLKKCEEECAVEMRKLHNEMWGMRKQNIAEQISLINIILNSVDAPELKAMLKVLESVKTTLNARASVNGIKDAEGGDK